MAWFASLVFFIACSPQFDWRQRHWQEASLDYQLPCKEDTHSKSLPLLDNAKMLKVQMRGCEHEGLVFGVAYAQVDKPEEAAATLLRWQKAYPRAAHLEIRTLLQGNKLAVLTVLDTQLMAQESPASAVLEPTQNNQKMHKAQKPENAPSARQQAGEYFLSHVRWRQAHAK